MKSSDVTINGLLRNWPFQHGLVLFQPGNASEPHERLPIGNCVAIGVARPPWTALDDYLGNVDLFAADGEFPNDIHGPRENKRGYERLSS